MKENILLFLVILAFTVLVGGAGAIATGGLP